MSISVWDPISGQAIATKPTEAQVTTHPLAGLVRMLTLPMLIVCLTGFGVAVFSETWMFHGIAAATVGFVFILLGSKLTGEEDNRRTRIMNAAHAGGHLGGTALPKPKIAQLAGRIKSLLVLRAGASIPLVLEHEIWGTARGDIPFWMGLSLVQSQAFFGGPKANVRSGPDTTHGEMAMFVVAYQLNRDTGIHAEIMPEFTTAKGPFDLDVKTESAQFNNRFNIRLREEDGQAVGKGVGSVALLRVLTPATQVTLLELSDTYAARVIVDRDVVFFGGYRNFQTTDGAALQQLLSQAVEDFATAATSFKTYAE
ncbi:MAG: hypothetical protein AAFO86_10220 [Pseudomonadota bacterium]